MRYTEAYHEDAFSEFEIQNNGEPCSMAQVDTAHYNNLRAKADVLGFIQTCEANDWHLIYRIVNATNKKGLTWCRKYGFERVLRYKGNDHPWVYLYVKDIDKAARR